MLLSSTSAVPDYSEGVYRTYCVAIDEASAPWDLETCLRTCRWGWADAIILARAPEEADEIDEETAVPYALLLCSPATAPGQET